jgi:5-methylcytosine-specific restriction enzyme subunit McrC
MKVPVQNIYYLLCYAWDEFAPKQLEKVAAEEFPDAIHLFARLLVTGVRSLHRRGFETGYVTEEQPTSSPRGRILMGETLRLIATQPSRVYCTYDEMSADVLSNQILKATLGWILDTEGVDLHLRADVRQARRSFDQISDIDLTARAFYRVRVHTNVKIGATAAVLYRREHPTFARPPSMRPASRRIQAAQALHGRLTAEP